MLRSTTPAPAALALLSRHFACSPCCLHNVALCPFTAKCLCIRPTPYPHPSSTHRDAARLREHYAEEHHPCNEGECADSLVAFATEAELKAHRLEKHSSKMPRFKRCVEVQYVLHGFGSSAVLCRSNARSPADRPGPNRLATMLLTCKHCSCRAISAASHLYATLVVATVPTCKPNSDLCCAVRQ
jgi:hypothetical protein